MTLEELYRLLRVSHVQAQSIVDTIQAPLLVLDSAGSVASANPAFFRTFHTSRDDTVGQSFFQLGNGQWDIPELRMLLAEVVPKAAAVVDYEVTHDFPFIGRRTMLLTARRLTHPEENSIHMLLVFRDVTLERRADADKDVQLAEAGHRLKNLLTMLHAVANQTSTDGLTAEQYRDTLMGRVKVVVESQILTATPGERVSLAELVSQAVEPIAGSRAVIHPGPGLSLAATQVMPISMTLHELVTNATKYGALSTQSGTVEIGWSTEQREGQQQLLLAWQERDGPPVTPPDRRGYGSNLIRHSMRSEGGTVEFDFAPAGLRVELSLPLTH